MSTKKSKSKLSGGRRQQERGEETSAVKGERLLIKQEPGWMLWGLPDRSPAKKGLTA